jgi:hypothetical protein
MCLAETLTLPQVQTRIMKKLKKALDVFLVHSRVRLWSGRSSINGWVSEAAGIGLETRRRASWPLTAIRARVWMAAVRHDQDKSSRSHPPPILSKRLMKVAKEMLEYMRAVVRCDAAGITNAVTTTMFSVEVWPPQASMPNAQQFRM